MSGQAANTPNAAGPPVDPAMEDRSPDKLQPATPDDLVEALWASRGRALGGRELRLELVMTGVFAACLGVLLAFNPPTSGIAPLAAAVVIAYALAARTGFAVGSGRVVPTQLFLVPLFALAPAQVVPLLVVLGLALSTTVTALAGQGRIDRLAFCGGDAIHALGPAIILTAFADGDMLNAGAGVLVLAFLAQLVFDCASTTLHDRLVFQVRPELELRVLLTVWGVDAALAPIGLLAAHGGGFETMAALPLVLLLSSVASDRSRRIAVAHDRLEELERERRRHQETVQRLGEAFAANLDLDALLEILTGAAVDAFDGAAGRGNTVGLDGTHGTAITVGSTDPRVTGALAVAEAAALVEGAPMDAGGDGVYAVAGVMGSGDTPVAVLSIARARPFSAEEREEFLTLCQQATVSAENARYHEQLRAAEIRLRHQAFHDSLTGLANRALFAEIVEKALQRQQRTGRTSAVLFVDLDRFKVVNDTLGHEAGDELLMIVAEHIAGCLRGADTAARLGGDEFAIVLEDLEDEREGMAVAERLRQQLSVPIRVQGRIFVVHGSVGVAFGAPGLERDELLRRADLAMYDAKQSGGNRIERFHPIMLTTSNSRQELSRDLRRAVGCGEFEVAMQPIVDLADSSIAAVEALVRWRHPTLGLLLPDRFVTLAEETGVIHDLGREVLDDSLAVAATWGSSLPRVPRICVNVSPVQLSDPGFAADVVAALVRHSFEPGRLTLEVTESAAIETDPQMHLTLRALHDAGVSLALDDFGTGYSSLSYLARLPVDILKLDQTFIANIETDPAQARLTEGVIRLASSLGLAVVAEGIEEIVQAREVQRLGVAYAQGYLFGCPMSPGALGQLLTRDLPAGAVQGDPAGR